MSMTSCPSATSSAFPIDLSSNAQLSRLQELYGELIPPNALWRELGYKSVDAFRQAAHRNTLPVPPVRLKHRRGVHAYSKDVAHWLAAVVTEQRCLESSELGERQKVDAEARTKSWPKPLTA